MNKSVFADLRFSLLLLCSIYLVGCTDSALIDTSTEITGKNWSYIKRVTFPVKIDNANKLYNVYFNLRHTADYKYSNIFVLIHQRSPGLKTITERREFQLAYPDGEWLGSGSGNLYSYQLLFKEKYKFPKAGTYVFEFEQNMRDNPLREISDVGIRVEPVE
ncbi:gliding motility lipoprotein GldH [Desertivirga xinjiangensis]|uniref:gliding motility lipoprotein GldH n=1 Tax=Desertivirga xinjiangensis TaxID=539206 RepID=UPI002108A1FB|nr:gliding motility lipoprotein GldH [Pedobacter xinjiangensis]